MPFGYMVHIFVFSGTLWEQDIKPKAIVETEIIRWDTCQDKTNNVDLIKLYEW